MAAKRARPRSVEVFAGKRNVAKEAIRLRVETRLRRLLIAVLNVEAVFVGWVKVTAQAVLLLIERQRQGPFHESRGHKQRVRPAACQVEIKWKADVTC